jgi:hypothetical protein
MNYIAEAVLVGIFEVFLYFVFSLFIKNFYALLIIVGFSKHFLGNWLGLQSWYCNNGSACLKTLNQGQKYVASTYHLLRSSVGEAAAHLILGMLLANFLAKEYLFFAIGVILHIGAENLGFHSQFCKENCVKAST